MSKVLRIVMPDGSVWEADAEAIARNRADHYTRLDGSEAGSDEWKAEFDFALKDEYELTDWAQNSMDWDELNAVMVQEPKPLDYASAWMQAAIKLVER